MNPGGYFIINGQTKYLIAIERNSVNDLMIYKKKDQHIASIHSKSFVDPFTNINIFNVILQNKFDHST